MKGLGFKAHYFCVFMLLVGLALLMTSDPAFAQANGDAGTNFSCTIDSTTHKPHAVGSLYDSNASCPKTMSFDHLFSYVICNMEQLSTNLLGNMFCGMITGLTPAVTAMLTLAVLFFGISFTIGLTPATGRDFMAFLLKIAFVLTFATQSDFIIGYGYKFLVGGISEGVAIALSNAVSSNWGGASAAVHTGSAVYDQLDAVIATFIHYATDSLSVDAAHKNVIDPADPNAGCKNALFAVMAIMAVAFPPIFYLSLALIGKLALALLRAVFGYIYALVGIAFLLTLSPFFVSFYLFHQTRQFFDKWLGYLASFTLQIIILFAFLSFILSIDVSNITKSFSTLVVRNQQTLETGAFQAPWDYCTLCQFRQVQTNATTHAVTPSGTTDNILNGGSLQCIKYATETVQDPRFPNDHTKTIVQPKKDAKGHLTEDANGVIQPITVLESAGPDKNQQKALLSFMSAGLLSLVILAYIIESLLGYVGSLAQNLSTGMGGYSAPQLGGGASLSGRPAVGMPFEGNITEFSGGFKRGFDAKPPGAPNDSLSAMTRGFKQGGDGLIHGHVGRSGQKEGGIGDRMLGWFTDAAEFNDDR